MESRQIMGMLAAALLLGAFLFEFALVPAAQPLPSDYFSGPEALAWLRGNENESALASNRFLETGNAIRFVNELYSAGATEVIVPDDAIVPDGELKYADALVVKLPDDGTQRRRVLDVCAPEMARQGASPEEVGNETQVYLWWD